MRLSEEVMAEKVIKGGVQIPFGRAYRKVVSAVNKPYVSSIITAGSRAMDIAVNLSKANLSGPMNIAATTIGLTNSFIKATNSYEDWRMAFEDNGLIDIRKFSDSHQYNVLCTILRNNRYFHSDYKSIYENKSAEINLRVKKLPSGAKIGVLFWEGEVKDETFFVSKDIKINDLTVELWRCIGNPQSVSISLKSYELSITAIKSFENNEYVGENLPRDLIMSFNRYKQKGINRAYLAVGPPGTGKTTFSFKVAKELSGKIMVISPGVLQELDVVQNAILTLIEAYSPSVLLLEDVDRISDGGVLLSLLDQLRSSLSDTLLISTANEPSLITSALRRPGRLGITLNFPAPNKEFRIKTIDLYSKKFGVGRDITHLEKYMDHPLYTHDYIKALCEQATVDCDEALIDSIKFTISTL